MTISDLIRQARQLDPARLRVIGRCIRASLRVLPMHDRDRGLSVELDAMREFEEEMR